MGNTSGWNSCWERSQKHTLNYRATISLKIFFLSKIEDDDNVCETVLVEIHAENDDSFVDKVL
jgi:hypothetical protein